MSSSDKTWVDNNPPTCAAADLNGFVSENDNLIIGSGQVPTAADKQQTHKSVAQYSSDGDFYDDAGAADAYVLTPLTGKEGIASYRDGSEVSFIPTNANTGPSTVNVNGLGVVNITEQGGSALASGRLPLGEVANIRYRTSSGDFKLMNPVPVAPSPGAAQTAFINAGQPVTGSTPLVMSQPINIAAATNYQITLYGRLSTNALATDVSLTVGAAGGTPSFVGSVSKGIDPAPSVESQTVSGATVVTSHTSAEDTVTGNQVHVMSLTLFNAGAATSLTFTGNQTGGSPATIGSLSVVVTTLA